MSNPTPTHFTDCQNDLGSLWGRAVSGPFSFQYANFSGSNLTSAAFYGGDLSYAIFRGSILRGADFRNANLTGVDFTNADLRRVYGPSSTLDGGTVVTGVIWANTTCPTNVVKSSPC